MNRPHRRQPKTRRYTTKPVLLTLICGEREDDGKPCDNPLEDGDEHYFLPAQKLGGDVPKPRPDEHVVTADPLTTGDITDAIARGDRFLRVLGKHH